MQVTTLLVKCPSAQWQPDGLTIHTEKWLPGAGFLGTHIYLFVRILQGFLGQHINFLYYRIARSTSHLSQVPSRPPFRDGHLPERRDGLRRGRPRGTITYSMYSIGIVYYII